mmetsp:Transcript_110923/g.353659  ORF Transcript_110923/g.353659 Transcript_110923/m.353659 type:complete len:251 (+) Transcript_110923:143-895(+)
MVRGSAGNACTRESTSSMRPMTCPVAVQTSAEEAMAASMECKRCSGRTSEANARTANPRPRTVASSQWCGICLRCPERSRPQCILAHKALSPRAPPLAAPRMAPRQRRRTPPRHAATPPAPLWPSQQGRYLRKQPRRRTCSTRAATRDRRRAAPLARRNADWYRRRTENSTAGRMRCSNSSTVADTGNSVHEADAHGGGQSVLSHADMPAKPPRRPSGRPDLWLFARVWGTALSAIFKAQCLHRPWVQSP